MARDLRTEWKGFLAKRSKAELRKLKEAGFDLANPEAPHDPYTRVVDTTPGQEDDDCAVTNKKAGDRSTRRDDYFMDRSAKDEETDPAMDFAVAVAARVIDAFDCTSNKAVALHADCFRLAIGYPSCGSQSDVARRHGVNRANVSFHVRTIQRKVGLPFTLVANSRQKVRSR